jgi:hypothetical protein
MTKWIEQGAGLDGIEGPQALALYWKGPTEILDALRADEGTQFGKFCFDQPEIREPDDPAQFGHLRRAATYVGAGYADLR